MNRKASLVFAAACLWAVSAFAQWQWVDKDGRRVFSDQPPPAEVPQKNILRQPGSPRPAAADAASAPAVAASAAKAAPVGPRLPTKDAQLEARKKQADDEEAIKRKAEEERVAKAQAENCERAKRSQATLQSGVRLQQTNADGQRVVLDDAGRAAEGQRIQSIIDSQCK
jgi:type IV secretory pathway VirB10-like protein